MVHLGIYIIDYVITYIYIYIYIHIYIYIYYVHLRKRVGDGGTRAAVCHRSLLDHRDSKGVRKDVRKGVQSLRQDLRDIFKLM